MTPRVLLLQAAHEFGLSNFHETSHLLLSHHAYFAQIMELVRRHTGRYDLPLPYFLPTGYGHVKLMNAMSRECIDCRNEPPASWSVTQVASQVAISGLQGRPQARSQCPTPAWI